MNDSASTPGVTATSNSAASKAVDEATLAPPSVGETCAYLSPSRFNGCRMPRSCQSCLMTAGCMVDTSGVCASTQNDALDPSQDFRLAKSQGLVLPNATADGAAMSATQMWQFPAGQVKYCNMGDAVCSNCVRTNFWRNRNVYPDSRYCLGSDGECVCIDVCERRWYVQQDCSSRYGSRFGPAPSPSPASATNMTNDPSAASRIWQVMVGSIVFLVVAMVFVLWSRRKSEVRTRSQEQERRRQQQARREQRRHTKSDELGVNTLNLSGWETYRRDLIDKEIAQLAGENDIKTPAPGDPNQGDVELHGGAISENHEISYVRMSEDNEQDSGRSGSVAPVANGDETAAISGGPSSAGNSSSSSETPAPTLGPITISRTLRPQR